MEVRHALSTDAIRPLESLETIIRCDTNADGFIAPIDALQVINGLNNATPTKESDVNDDGVVAPLDALLVVSRLNQKGASRLTAADLWSDRANSLVRLKREYIEDRFRELIEDRRVNGRNPRTIVTSMDIAIKLLTDEWASEEQTRKALSEFEGLDRMLKDKRGRVGPDGADYYLSEEGSLHRWDAGIDQLLSRGPFIEFKLSPQGVIGAITINGALSLLQNDQWIDVAGGHVTKFGFMQNNSFFWLTTEHELWHGSLENKGYASTLACTATKDFFTTSSGTIIVTDLLDHVYISTSDFPATFKQITTSPSVATRDPDGSVYILQRSGRLTKFDPETAITDVVVLNQSVSSFLLGPDGRKYAVDILGRLYSSATGLPGSFTMVFSDLSGIQFNPFGTLFVLRKDGALFRSLTGESGSFEQVTDEPVRRLVFATDHAIYLYGRGNRLLRSPTGKADSFSIINDEAVAYFEVADNGKVVILQHDGGLVDWKDGKSETLLSEPVSRFLFGPDHSMYVITAGSALRSTSGDAGSFDVVSDKSVSDIMFTHAGGVVITERDGGLIYSSSGERGTYNRLLDEPVSNMVLAADSSVYLTTATRLLRSATWERGSFVEVVSEPIKSLVIRDYGVFVLERDGGFLCSVNGTPGTYNRCIKDEVLHYEFGPDGSLYLVTPQRLLRSQTGLFGTFVVIDDEPVERVAFGSDNSIMILEKDGGLIYSANGRPGTYSRSVDDAVTRVISGPDGAVYAFLADGVKRSDSGEPGTFISIVDEPVESLNFGPGRSVFILEKDGGLVHSLNGLPGTYNRSVDEAVTRLVFGPDGAVYAITADRLLRSATGERGSFAVIDNERVESVTFGSGWRVYLLESDGGFLSSENGEPGTYARCVDKIVTRFISGPNGSLYVFSADALLRSESGECDSFLLIDDEPVDSVTFGPGLDVYILEKDGGFLHSSSGRPGTFNRSIDEVVTAICVGADESVYLITPSRLLRSETGERGSFVVVDNEPIERLFLGVFGRVYILERDGGFVYSPSGRPGTYTRSVDEVVTSFSVDSVDAIYLVSPSRLLRSETGKRGSFVVVDDEPIGSLTFGPQGRIYILERDGGVVYSASGRPGTYNRIIDEVVTSLSIASDGSVFLITPYRLLRSETGERGSFVVVDNEPVRGVSFGAQGRVFILEKDGGFVYSASGKPGTYIRSVDEEVVSISVSSEGTVYLCTPSRVLLSETGERGSFTTLGNGRAQSIVFGRSGDAFILWKDGRLQRLQRFGEAQNLSDSIVYLQRSSTGGLLWYRLTSERFMSILGESGLISIISGRVKAWEVDCDETVVVWADDGALFRVDSGGIVSKIAVNVEQFGRDSDGKIVWSEDGGLFDDLWDIIEGVPRFTLETAKSLAATSPVLMAARELGVVGGILAGLGASEVFGPDYSRLLVKGFAIEAGITANVFTGGMLAPVSTTLVGSVLSGAVSGAIGSLSSQAVLISGGQQKGLGWSEVTVGALVQAVSNGIEFDNGPIGEAVDDGASPAFAGQIASPRYAANVRGMADSYGLGFNDVEKIYSSAMPITWRIYNQVFTERVAAGLSIEMAGFFARRAVTTYQFFHLYYLGFKAVRTVGEIVTGGVAKTLTDELIMETFFPGVVEDFEDELFLWLFAR